MPRRSNRVIHASPSPIRPDQQGTRLALATAPHDEAVAADFAIGTGRYRDGVALVARRLASLGALTVDVDEATDVLWYFFGYASLFTLVDDNGWTYDRAEKWLGRAASDALLRR